MSRTGVAQRPADHARANLRCDECGADPGSPCAGHPRIVCSSRYAAAETELRRQALAARRPGSAEETAALLASLPPVPAEEIEACRTEGGGYSFTRERLASWGVPWPPPAGWRKALTRRQEGTR